MLKNEQKHENELKNSLSFKMIKIEDNVEVWGVVSFPQTHSIFPLRALVPSFKEEELGGMEEGE